MHKPPTQIRLFLFILQAGALAALLASLFSALVIAVLSALQPLIQTSRPPVWDIIKAAILLVPITAVSCGPYGLLTGTVGAALLKLRRSRIRSARRLALEAAILGFLLGFFFPFFDGLMNRGGTNGMQIVFSAPVGMLCAIICALTLRTHLVTQTPSIP